MSNDASSGKKKILKELQEVDQEINPHTGKPHGPPQTPREKRARDRFAELHGRQEDGPAGNSAPKKDDDQELVMPEPDTRSVPRTPTTGQPADPNE